MPVLEIEGRSAVKPDIAAARFLAGLPQGAHIMVALSGGGDSVGLLIALHMAARQNRHDIVISTATVDHGLRAESAAEAAAMAQLCETLGIRHMVMRWEGEKPLTGVSEKARAERYRLLLHAAEVFEVDAIVTGHTVNDQLETVEMRWQRSQTSERGLAGMADAVLFEGRKWVFRPFLSVERQDIRSFLHENAVRWFDDPSNENEKYERVRTRVAGRYHLTPTEIDAYALERSRISAAAAEIISRHVTMPVPLLFEMDLALQAEEEAFQLAVMTLMAVAGGRTHLPGQAQIENVWPKLAADAPDFRLSLSRTVLERRRNRLFICRDNRNLPGESALAAGAVVAWDDRFRVENNGSISVRLLAGAAQEENLDIPPRVLSRALASLPAVSACTEEDCGGTVVIQPILKIFDEVLPRFDILLANALSRLVRGSAFRSPLSLV